MMTLNYLKQREQLMEDIDCIVSAQYGQGNEELADEMIELLCDACLLYTSPSPRDRTRSRMPSSA